MDFTLGEEPVTNDKGVKYIDGDVTSVHHLQGDSQSEIIQELRQIRLALSNEPSPQSQILWNFVLQILALTIGVLFGAFSILAWMAATQANDIASNANTYASTAVDQAYSANVYAASALSWASVAWDDARANNQLALVGYCQSNTGTLCASITSSASDNVAALASSYFGITATPLSSTDPSSTMAFSTPSSTNPFATSTSVSPPAATTDPNASSSPASHGIKVGPLIGGVIGGIVFVMAVGIGVKAYRDKIRLMNDKGDYQRFRIVGDNS